MYEVTVTFVLKEDVTPDYFAGRVAIACANGYAIRPGEGVKLSTGEVITAEKARSDLVELLNVFKKRD